MNCDVIDAAMLSEFACSSLMRPVQWCIAAAAYRCFLTIIASTSMTMVRCSAEKRVHLSLLANPSHLEAVDPIVLGKVRPSQHNHGTFAAAHIPDLHWSCVRC